MYSLVLNMRGASRQRSKCVLNSWLYSKRQARVCYSSYALWITSLALSLCGDPSCRRACAKVTPKRARQTRTAFFFCLAFSGLSLSTSAWCQAPDESSSTGGDQCMGFNHDWASGWRCWCAVWRRLPDPSGGRAGCYQSLQPDELGRRRGLGGGVQDVVHSSLEICEPFRQVAATSPPDATFSMNTATISGGRERRSTS
jgi:hypothetical protein